MAVCSIEGFHWSGSLHLSHLHWDTVSSTYSTISKFIHKNWHPGPKGLNSLYIPQRCPWRFYFHSVLKVMNMELGVRRTQHLSLTFEAIQTYQSTLKICVQDLQEARSFPGEERGTPMCALETTRKTVCSGVQKLERISGDIPSAVSA